MAVPRIPAPMTTASASWCSFLREAASSSIAMEGGGEGEGESRIKGIVLAAERVPNFNTIKALRPVRV